MSKSLCVLILLLAWAIPGSAATLYFNNFETNDGGWTSSGDWEWGVVNYTGGGCDSPQVGPAGAASGTSAWGTVLGGCYANSGATSSLSRQFDLTGVSDAQLEWEQWIHVFTSFDSAQTFVNGVEVYSRIESTGTTDWEKITVDLTPFVGGLVTVQFDMFATTVVNRAGWYIDDVHLTTSGDAVIPEPGTVVMLASALGLLWFGRRRQSRA